MVDEGRDQLVEVSQSCFLGLNSDYHSEQLTQDGVFPLPLNDCILFLGGIEYLLNEFLGETGEDLDGGVCELAVDCGLMRLHECAGRECDFDELVEQGAVGWVHEAAWVGEYLLVNLVLLLLTSSTMLGWTSNWSAADLSVRSWSKSSDYYYSALRVFQRFMVAE